jgi:hypothetical protein
MYIKRNVSKRQRITVAVENQEVLHIFLCLCARVRKVSWALEQVHACARL